MNVFLICCLALWGFLYAVLIYCGIVIRRANKRIAEIEHRIELRKKERQRFMSKALEDVKSSAN